MASPSNPRISAVNPRQLPLPSRTSPMPRALSAATAAVLTSAPSSLTLDQPRFDLGFDKVQGRMDSFLSNLSQTIVRGRQRFMNDKNDYLQQLNQLQGTCYCCYFSFRVSDEITLKNFESSNLL